MINLLPFNGTVHYYKNIIDLNQADQYLRLLQDVMPWINERLTIFGKEIILSRKVAWFSDRDYRYGGSTKYATTWPHELIELKKIVEKKTKSHYNACLLNLYHNGEEGMGWHNDNESSIVKHSTIASLSLGAARKFSFKHQKTGEIVSVILENGSLLLMKDETQDYWKHSLPKSRRINEPRINLTFRTMI